MKNEIETSGQAFESKYTFWRLLSEYQIEIPIIQRDYAQGRTTENETAIRTELVSDIYNALVHEEPLDFDFVYGSVDENNNGKKLYPLDGQQRLTTFFLLHWYLAEKEDRMSEARDVLRSFSYSTRISSRDFCEMLVEMDYTPNKSEAVSSCIENENKYFLSWNQDPTIRAMLVMLDAIHKQFFDCAPLFDKLLDEDASLITFHFLPMEHYALTDDLYIKMNARGKALSVFENFKAKFIQHLRDNGFSLSHFEASIDNAWTDLLWDYRSENDTIDKQFMRLFCFFTEMIYLLNEQQTDFEKSPFRVSNVRKLVDYYDSEEKVQLFYQLMDLWSGKEEAKAYLEEIMSTEKTAGKVRIFDGQPDIFSDIINGNNVSIPNRILLFSIMMRLIRLGKDSDRDSTLDYVRIARNFLIKTRAFNRNNCSYTQDFRFGRHGIPYASFITNYLSTSDNPYEVIREEYSDDFDGINTEVYKQESTKAAIILDHPELKKLILGLEDLNVFRGSIFNVLDYAVESQDDSLIDNIEALFVPQNSDAIISALLSIGDYGISVKSSFLGDKYFYGNKTRWYEILTYSGGKRYTSIITEFIRQYQDSPKTSIKETLQEIVDRQLPTIELTDWRYCLIKYPSTIKDYKSITFRNLLFAFEQTGKTTRLHRMNGNTLNAYHVIPEYIEVVSQLGDDCDGDIYGQNSNNLGEIHLSCRDGISILFDESGGITIKDENNEDSQLANEAYARYNRLDLSEKDLVEKFVIMANIIKELSEA